MTENRGRKIRFVYGVVFAVLTIAVGALFIAQAWSIYFSADSAPYTAKSISEHFSKIAIPVWLWVVALVGNIALAFVFPETENRPAPYIELNTTIAKLQRRIPDAELKQVRKDETYRLILGVVAGVLSALSAVAILVLLFDKSYTPWASSAFFTQHGGVADRLVRCTPWLFAGFIICIVVTVLLENSKKKQIARLKTVIADNAKKGVKAEQKPQKPTWEEKLCKKFPFLKSPKLVFGVRIGLCVAGIALFAFGIYNGGMTDVYEKAKNICTQCIGLG